MREIIQKLDAKAIAMLITSVGGILLAAYFGYLSFTTFANHLSGVEETLKDSNSVMRESSGNIQANTAVLNIIEARGR